MSDFIEYIILDISRIIGFILIIAAGFLISKMVVSKVKNRDIKNENEIITLLEIIILAAFFLTALEFIGVKATALIELYKVILYMLGALIIILIIKPNIFKEYNKKK